MSIPSGLPPLPPSSCTAPVDDSEPKLVDLLKKVRAGLTGGDFGARDFERLKAKIERYKDEDFFDYCVEDISYTVSRVLLREAPVEPQLVDSLLQAKTTVDASALNSALEKDPHLSYKIRPLLEASSSLREGILREIFPNPYGSFKPLKNILPLFSLVVETLQTGEFPWFSLLIDQVAHELLLLGKCELLVTLLHKIHESSLGLRIKKAVETAQRGGFHEERALLEKEFLGREIAPQPLAAADWQPLLEDYRPDDRRVSEAHKRAWEGGDAQLTFQHLFSQTVVDLLPQFAALAKTPEGDFKALVDFVGVRREQIAQQCGTKDRRNFGHERIKLFLTTPLKPLYARYVEKFRQAQAELPERLVWLGRRGFRDENLLEKSKVITGEFEGKELLLTELKGSEWGEPEWFNLFEHRDEVMRAIVHHLKVVVVGRYERVEDLARDIGRFHWWFANGAPFCRGSAACAEMLTDALWLFHGSLPPKPEPGVSQDCEALCTPNIDRYIDAYPVAQEARRKLI